MTTVSAGDFLKDYGRIVETAQREPVSITKHGRPSLVLMSAREYERLKANDRRARRPWELGEDEIRALEASEPSAASEQFDHEIPSR